MSANCLAAEHPGEKGEPGEEGGLSKHDHPKRRTQEMETTPPPHGRVHRREATIRTDNTHPQHGLLTLLPSGRRYRSVKCGTTPFTNSLYPTAIRILHSHCD